MQVILLETVNNLGKKDDLVSVKDGFGMNFLIPNKKAIIASKSNKKQLFEKQLQSKHKLEKIKKETEELANKLTEISSLQIFVNARPNGTIFGSINTIQISHELAKKGFKIEKDNISIQKNSSIKEIGYYKINVILSKDFTVEIPLEIKSK